MDQAQHTRFIRAEKLLFGESSFHMEQDITFIGLHVCHLSKHNKTEQTHSPNHKVPLGTGRRCEIKSLSGQN
jgi:hypothetical protein